jgi:hypothetical protein
MKKVLILGSLLCVSLMAQPAWYYNLKKSHANIYIGYGQASSEKEAKANALQDIASKISVTVQGNFSKNVSVHNGEVDRQLTNLSQQKSKAQIKDYKILKSELDTGKYYVAIAYENISSIDRFIKKVRTKLPKVNEKQNRYLSQTLIAKRLKRRLGVSIDFNLQRKDGLWYIAYQGVLVSLDKRTFESFFKTVPNRELRLTTSKKGNKLFNGDVFHFKLRSQQTGFVSILTVYEDGTVATLVRNIPVKAGVTENIPDKDFESELQAALIKPGVETFDQYVAIYSPKKMILDSFAAADEELITHERYKNFDMLIGLLDTMTYTTLKVVTKPR